MKKQLGGNSTIILVCGDRHWSDFKTIERFLSQYDPKETTIVEGDSWGADKIAGYVGRKLGMKVIPVPANWSLGKRAGPVRNQTMLDKYKPNLVAGFHNDFENSKGTKDMITRAKAQGYTTCVFSSQEFSTKPLPQIIKKPQV